MGGRQIQIFNDSQLVVQLVVHQVDHNFLAKGTTMKSCYKYTQQLLKTLSTYRITQISCYENIHVDALARLALAIYYTLIHNIRIELFETPKHLSSTLLTTSLFG